MKQLLRALGLSKHIYAVEVFKDSAGQFRTRIRCTQNGQVVYTDEDFDSEQNAWRKARTFSKNTGIPVDPRLQ